MTGANTSLIKLRNQSLFLNLAREKDGISRVDFATISGLTKGGTTTIAAELIQLGLLHESEVVDTPDGRKPTLLKLTPNTCHVIAVQWSRTSMVYSLVDFAGGIRYSNSFCYGDDTSLESLLDTLARRVDEMISRMTPNNLLGLSLVTPGPLDIERGVILNPPMFHGWNNIPVVEMLSKRLGLRVTLDNNANANAIAEKCYGLGRLFDNFVHVVVDEGVGTGIVLNRKIFRVSAGMCPEMGHITISTEGQRCTCGNIGCAELYVSGINMARYYLDRAGIDREGDWPEVLKYIVENAKKGDYLCTQALQREVYYLSNFFTTISNIFYPQAIILGSWIARCGYDFAKEINRELEKTIISPSVQKPVVVMSKLENPTILGAATNMFQQFVQGEFGGYESVLGGRNGSETAEV